MEVTRTLTALPGLGADPPIEVETTFLDLDGDGVPDAVQVLEACVVGVHGDGSPGVVEVVEEVATGIGIDGVPDRVAVLERVEVPLAQ